VLALLNAFYSALKSAILGISIYVSVYPFYKTMSHKKLCLCMTARLLLLFLYSHYNSFIFFFVLYKMLLHLFSIIHLFILT